MLSLLQSGSRDGTYPVYTGFWIDWSRGQVLGSTLTLTREDANLFIAFVAFFLTIVTTQLWSIACFAFHSFFSTEDPRDILHHQRQALLRNNGAPAGMALTLVRLVWAWRHRSSGAIRRVLPLLACTMLLAIGFAAAAGFSSKIALSNTVLLTARNCSQRSNQHLSPDLESNVLVPWQAKQLNKASNYAEQCYSTSETVTGCLNGEFVRRELPMSIDSDAPCPFGGDICSSNSSNIRIESGFIDSHFDLGVNAPPDERFQFRTTLRCAPLTTKGYRSSHTRSDNQTFSRYHYGPSLNANYTYEYPIPDSALYYSKTDNDTGFGDSLNYQYSLSSFIAQSYNGSYESPNVDFLPIPELSIQEADVYLLFLSPNQILFPQPTADPWYNSSHSGALWQDTAYYYSPNGSFRAYVSTEAASPLGCTYQEQYCFPELPAGQNCTPPAGIIGSGLIIQQFGLRNETVRRVFWTHNSFNAIPPMLPSIVSVLGTSSLKSRSKLNAPIQGFLPPNQWQLDVQNWNSVSLSLTQQSMISTVLGDLPAFPDSDVAGSIQYAESEEEKTICSNQKINSAYHISFSVFGIAVIAVVGLLVVITSFTIEPVTHFIQRRLNRSAYRRLEWISMGTLQLQRQLYEAHGIDEWKDCDETIPVLEQQGALLPALDISDVTHPSTKRRSQHLKGRQQMTTEGSSETVVSDGRSAQNDHTQPQQEMTDIEQHRRVQQDDVPTHVDVLSIDERMGSREIPEATTELRDYMRPTSIQEALERRTSTYP